MPRAFFFEALSHREMDWILLLAKTSVCVCVSSKIQHSSTNPSVTSHTLLVHLLFRDSESSSYKKKPLHTVVPIHVFACF